MRVAGVGRIVSPYVSKLEWKLYEWAIQSWLKTARVSILDAHSAILKKNGSLVNLTILHSNYHSNYFVAERHNRIK